MATNTERIDKLDDRVNYLQAQEKLLTQKIDLALETRDGLTKLREEIQKLQTTIGVRGSRWTT